MRQKRYTQLVIGLITTCIMGALIIVGLGITDYLTSAATLSATTTNQPLNNNQEALGANAPTSTIMPSAVPSASPTATPAVGEVIPLPPKLVKNGDLVMRRTDKPALLSQLEAMQAVSIVGIPWALGGQYQGKMVTVSATYGLGTQGHLASDGKTWIGYHNIKLQTCTGPGKCVATGKVLDHIENRPMWIIDYGNTVFYASRFPGNPPVPDDNHTVYVVDEETKTVLFMWGYYEP